MGSTYFSPTKQRILLLELVNGEAKQISGWSRSHLRIEIEPYYGDWRLGTDAPAETSGTTTMHSKLQLLVVLIMDPMPMEPPIRLNLDSEMTAWSARNLF